ncbi:MAG: hypothetical protein R2697_13685 [Ilumatobacteraceae bacterium]
MPTLSSTIRSAWTATSAGWSMRDGAAATVAPRATTNATTAEPRTL